MSTQMIKRYFATFANDNDALVPEIWANEALMVLYNNLVMAQLVHREFSTEIASEGDTVNTRRPAKFVDKRKIDSDEVTDQDASSTNVAVKLDQHHHVTFVIKDGEESKGMGSLIDLYLTPALEAVAQGLDEMVQGEKFNFLANVVGKLGTSITKATDIAIGTKLSNNKAGKQGRKFVFSPTMEGDLQNIGDFMNANTVGDNGTSLQEGHIGRKFGLDHIMSMNYADTVDTDVVTGAVNLGAGYAIGTTVLTVDGLSAAINNGSWCTVAGDMTPQRITATVGGATPTELTITPGLRSAVVDDAVITIYAPYKINFGAGYAAGYTKPLTVDTRTVAAPVGSLISQGVYNYGAMSTPTTIELLASRALEAAATDDDVFGVGPAGDYGFAFHRNAIALVTRPLAMPRSGTGALAAVADLNGIGVRVVITYDGKAQGHRVTIDVLAGVKTLDTNLGVVVLG